MYHVDAPTGNIKIEGIKPFLNPAHPYVERAVPLSLGDSYRGHRVVGTSPTIIDLYSAEFAEGENWKEVMEVVVGAQAAEELDLKMGDKFQSSHGLQEDSFLIHEEAPNFKVAGILQRAGNVIDQLIMTSNQSVWAVHDDHAHGEEDDHDDHSGHDHAPGEHPTEDEVAPPNASDLSVPLTSFPDKSITSLLLQFKGNSVFSLNLQRSINENTNMQAATPSIEINRLYETMGPGETILKRLALAIVLVSIFSIFISLYTSLDERRKELALMRSLGGSRTTLLGLLLTEGLILAVGGTLLGLLLSHLGLYFIAQLVSAKYRYDFAAFFLLPAELWLLAAAFVVGLVAALIPALRAANTDVHKTLSE
jgi:putative ABC transport system permease protein